MKKMILLLLVASQTLVATSQTFNEWFRQKATQKKYLLQQIVALEVLNRFVKGGYAIAKAGSDRISLSKEGDYRLHNNFFRSLGNVSTTVKSYGRIAAIVSFGTKILSQSKGAINNARTSKQLTPEEILHVSGVFQFLIGECGKTIDYLIAVTTNEERRMTEDERIRRIDELYQEMQRQYSFCCSFGESVAMLCRQRAQEQQDINRSKTINGLQ